MKLTDEDRARLKAANPDALVVRTKELPDHDFVFRQMRVQELDAFLGAVNGDDETAKVNAHRTLAKDLLVFPADDVWDDVVTQKPAVAHTIGVELSKRAGLNATVQVDTL